jgi:hypothetical protein
MPVMPITAHCACCGPLCLKVKQMMKVTYICRSPQKKAATYFIFLFYFFIHFLSRFWAFRNKGSSQTRKRTFGIWAYQKKSKKCGSPPVFFLTPPSPSFVLVGFFIAFLGVSQDGEFKNTTKKSQNFFRGCSRQKALTHLCHSPPPGVAPRTAPAPCVPVNGPLWSVAPWLRGSC